MARNAGKWGEDARTFDFLGGGGTDLIYDPLPPALTQEQIDMMDHNRMARAAQKKDAISDEYRKVRAASDQAAIATSNLSASSPEMLAGTGAWNFSGLDWGLLPAAAAVVTQVVAIAASGGLAAPVLAANWSKVKKVVSSIDSAKEASDTVFRVKDYVGDKFVAANAVADKILGDVSVENAHGIIANTQALAMAGDPEAQRAAVILDNVAAARKSAGLGPGQALFPVVTAAHIANVMEVTGESVHPLTAREILTVSDVRHSSWWRRLLLKLGIGDGEGLL